MAWDRYCARKIFVCVERSINRKTNKKSPSRGILPLKYLLANNEATPTRIVEEVLTEGTNTLGLPWCVPTR